MSRTLPPRPDFTQLKHQAKDLLRAHERKVASACAVLRRLRRFDTADDAAIFAAPLALHEAQYALVMEYGFASWNALKRHVEKVTGRPSPVRRENGRTYVAGLEKHPIGGDGEHENSIIASMAGVMAAMGECFSYEYLMGVSGAAFRVQLHQPNWCPSAACAPCGYNCMPGAMKATGYRLTWIDTQRDGRPLPEGIERAFAAVQASVERGVPVILAGKEAGLIVGYHADGRRILRPYCHDVEGYKDTKGLGNLGATDALPASLVAEAKAGDWAWGVGIIEPEDVPMDRRDAVANSLRLAVTLAKTERFDKYLSGFAALETWANQLADDGRFAGMDDKTWFGPAHANGYCFGCLWSCRKSAQKYLQEIAGDFEEPIHLQLLEVASVYKQIDQTLGRKRPEFACAWSLMPWRIKSPANWTPQMRHVQSDVLREVLALERQAVAKIENVLTLLDPPKEPSQP